MTDTTRWPRLNAYCGFAERLVGLRVENLAGKLERGGLLSADESDEREKDRQEAHRPFMARSVPSLRSKCAMDGKAFQCDSRAHLMTTLTLDK